MARPASGQPTDGELEILNVLWDLGPSELGVVRGALLERRPVAASTVATMLRVMAEKGLVERYEGSRPLWKARISREAARTGLLRRLVERAFDGSAQRLVAHLVERGELSAEERQAIRALLEEGAGEARPKGKGRGRS